MPEPMYYIQNINHPGDWLIWWKPEGLGYTKNLDEAWKLPHDRAVSVCADRPKEDFMWPCEMVDKLATRQLNFKAVGPLTRRTAGLIPRQVKRQMALRSIHRNLEELLKC